MKVLVIGAGAVGQVYARHLQRGGARVSLYVKPRYEADCRAGLTMYPLKERGDGPVTFSAAEVLTDLAQVGGRRFDQVWLCMSTTAMRQPWLDEMLPVLGDATVVSLQPGLDERQYLEARHPSDLLAFGVIGFISWQTPLPGAPPVEPGVSYWFPPLSPSVFSGPEEAVRGVVRTLKRGGCPARRVDSATAYAAVPTAAMMPHLTALEAEGWSLRALRGSPLLPVAAGGAREAMTVAAAHLDRSPPLSRALVRPWLMRVALWAAPRLAPFDLESYLRYHFTKTGDQTRYLMQRYLEHARERGLPADSLARLQPALLPIGSSGESGEGAARTGG